MAFQREAHKLYQELVDAIRSDVVYSIFKVEVAPAAVTQPRYRNITYGRGGSAGQDRPREPERRAHPNLGRNDPCWCGSGKKYKHCHWAADHGYGTDGRSGQAPTATAQAATVTGTPRKPKKKKKKRKKR